ncbi:hypothetical protein [Streptomyces sp. NPDC005438]|uniref:DUF6912 family protein n=1 Tax=Streptomyces sp. NPDC005438 TaxID=3156880 RepID=UPI0033B36CA6
MRVYLPLTLSALRQAHGAGELGPAPRYGYAVTGELREWAGSEDQEELEYLALHQAAEASLRLLADDREEPDHRRVVIAVEWADAEVRTVTPEDDDPGRVRLEAPVPLDRVRAVHLDDPDHAPLVAEAAEALSRHPGPDREAAPEPVERIGERELLWYAPQEIAYLV